MECGFKPVHEKIKDDKLIKFCMLEQLLSEISTIVNAYKIVKKAKGENFNIYKILGISSAEVKTHSKFLAELLNSNGSHGQDDVFLQLFLKQVGLSDNDFNTENANASVEYYISPKTETTGGRIDILIVDKNNKKIIIENKIYAGDQENQLLRYYNFDKNAKLLYLTLEGTSPSEWSTGGKLEDKDYTNISYQVDIIQWLENCKKEAVNFPILRESISQYIHLINYLTNQTSDNKMSENISEIVLKNESNFSTFLELKNNQNQVYVDFWEKVFKPQLEKVANGFELKIGYENSILSNNNQFYFFNDDLKEKNISIGFAFEGKNILTKFDFGIRNFNSDSSHINIFKSKFNEKFVGRNSEGTAHWPAYLDYKEYENWTADNLLEIYKNPNENEIIKDIKEKVTIMLDVINEVLG